MMELYRRDYRHANFNDLKGKTFVSVIRGDDEVNFYLADGSYYSMTHVQQCCEGVSIEDIVGDLSDLENTEILYVDGTTEDGECSDWSTSTWTFYNLRTIKGSVTMRWYGSSNGYYSESVDILYYPATNEE